MTPKDKAMAVYEALTKGPIDHYNLPMVGQFLMTMTELHDAIRLLNRVGVKCGRTDAGGHPTWALR